MLLFVYRQISVGHNRISVWYDRFSAGYYMSEYMYAESKGISVGYDIIYAFCVQYQFMLGTTETPAG